MTLNPRAAFILGYRQALAVRGKGSSLSDAQLYKLGETVCTARANGASQSALMSVSGMGGVLNRLAEKDLCPQYG